MPRTPGQTAPVTPLTALQRFRILIRAAQKHSQWIEKKSGISGVQLWALQELAEAPGLRVGELARRMALHQSTASNLMERLEHLGLARRERSNADQRVVLLSITDLGRATLARAPTPARGLLPEALRHMAADDLKRLQSALDVLLRQADAMDEGFGMLPLPFTEESPPAP